MSESSKYLITDEDEEEGVENFDGEHRHGAELRASLLRSTRSAARISKEKLVYAQLVSNLFLFPWHHLVIKEKLVYARFVILLSLALLVLERSHNGGCALAPPLTHVRNQTHSANTYKFGTETQTSKKVSKN